MQFVKNCIFIAPSDESLWSVLSLLITLSGVNVGEIFDFITDLIDTLDPDDFRPLIYFAELAVKTKNCEKLDQAKKYLSKITGNLQQGVVHELRSQLDEMSPEQIEG